MKIFIKSREGLDIQDKIEKLFPASLTVFHDQVAEKYFSTEGSPSAEAIGWLIPVSTKTFEFLCQVEDLGRFRITNEHPVYKTLVFENDYD